MSALLFSPITIENTTVENRICVPPMCQCRADNGLARPWHTMHYGRLMNSGAGLVVVEATAVSPEGRITTRCLGLYDDAQQQALAKLVHDCRAVAARPKLFIQLSHAGRKGSRDDPARGKRVLSPEEGGFELIAPTAGSYFAGTPAARMMTEDDIERVIADFAAAAARAAAAGFDGIQLHAAHGYLLHQFLSPVTNKRTDRWGGSRDNRMRFALAVIEAVKKAAEGVPLALRLPASDWIEGGWQIEDTVAFVEKARDLGVAAVDVSVGGGIDPAQTLPAGQVMVQKYSRTIREATGIITYAAGHITEPLQAEAVLAAGDADGVCIGREMIRNPNWGWRAAQELHAVVQVPAPYVPAFF